MILAAAVIVSLSAVFVSLRQDPLFSASAGVLLSRQSLSTSLTGTGDPTVNQQADRVADTQAALARVPAVVERVLSSAGIDNESPDEFLDRSDVSPRHNADLLEFTVRAPTRALAAHLATDYARKFTEYRRILDSAALLHAHQEVERQIEEIESSGSRRSPLLKSLRRKERDLQTALALQTPNAVLVRPANKAEQVRPRPVRNGLVALTLGLLLGVAFASLREALDTRLRLAKEVGESLGLPLLGRLSTPPKRLRREDKLVTLAARHSYQAEQFRVLRTNFELAIREHGARTIMVTSAEDEEGKSTTLANLGVALAGVGRRVAIVDCDLRRPSLARFFGLEGRPGLSDVGLGRADLSTVVVPLAVAENPDGSLTATSDRMQSRRVLGALQVLPAGRIPPSPGEFVGSGVLDKILADLHEFADIVLVDAPPLLCVGDAIALSKKVDGIIVVTRLNAVRKPIADELVQALRHCPATTLGFALTGAEAEGVLGYVYGRHRRYKRLEGAAVA